MPSKREQILSALVTLLTGTTPAGASVFRSRVTAIGRDESPAIIVRPEEDIPEKQFAGVTIATLAVAIDVYTRGDVPDQLADPIIVAAHARIMVDPTLGGLASLTLQGPAKWESHEADQTAGFSTFIYHIRYTTQVFDLTQ
ncbi:hypothetical protein [Nitrosospira briensis]|uniref:hypothetical protein n=1 Tax=Nitrosospira briensis TaxID=35799 RepID=UPI00046AD6A2|nr:hypothetical protein [Nitrosospira briensis]